MVDIRPAELSDARRIAEIHVDSWRVAYREIVPAQFLADLSVERRREVWVSRFGDRQAFVAQHDGRVIGFIRVGPAEEPNLGEVQSIYVDPATFRRGAGTELMKAGEARLLELGFTAGILWVFVDNAPARRFYEAMGWEAEARTALMELGGRQLTEIRYHKALA